MVQSRKLLALLIAVSALLHLMLVLLLPVTAVRSVPTETVPPAPAALRVRLMPAGAVAAVPIALPLEPIAQVERDGGAARPPVTGPAGGAMPLPFVPAPDAAYLGRAQLSVGPEPIGVIVIPDPGPLANAAGSLAVKTVTLTVFINEYGNVERLRFDAPGGDLLLEQAARKAFQNARFTPGELDGKPVKSRIRIEVGFEPLR